MAKTERASAAAIEDPTIEETANALPRTVGAAGRGLSMGEADPALAARYGRGGGTRRRDRRLLWGAAAAFVVVFVAWVIWGGLDGDATSVKATDTAHSIVDARTVSVTYQLVAPVNTPAYCLIQALDTSFGVVGWKVYEVPASDRPLRSLTETVRTTGEATTGLIKNCWLP